MPITSYTPTTWVDDDGSGTTGTTFDAAKMNNIEDAVDEIVDDIQVESVTAVSFATGWSNFGGAYQTVGYYKDRGRVFLRGSAKNGGTGTGLIFTLPSGYRPAADLVIPVMFYGGTGPVTITSSGTVTDGTFSTASKAFIDLSSISFRI